MWSPPFLISSNHQPTKKVSGYFCSSYVNTKKKQWKKKRVFSSIQNACRYKNLYRFLYLLKDIITRVIASAGMLAARNRTTNQTTLSLCDERGECPGRIPASNPSRCEEYYTTRLFVTLYARWLSLLNIESSIRHIGRFHSNILLRNRIRGKKKTEKIVCILWNSLRFFFFFFFLFPLSPRDVCARRESDDDDDDDERAARGFLFSLSFFSLPTGTRSTLSYANSVMHAICGSGDGPARLTISEKRIAYNIFYCSTFFFFLFLIIFLLFHCNWYLETAPKFEKIRISSPKNNKFYLMTFKGLNTLEINKKKLLGGIE